MTRRGFFTIFALPLFAGSEEVLDALTSIASALSEGNAIAFLRPFDPAIKGYEQLSANVMALVVQADIVCSIEILTESGDDQTRSAQLDWFLQLKSKAENGPLERRRQIVQVKLAKRGKKWKIVAFDPASILSPMQLA